MKKSLIALAALSAVAGAAQAQSSVEIYGILDMSYSQVESKGSGTSVKLNSLGGQNSVNGSGVLNGTRLGFRGTEDLGGGTKAGFVIEYGVNLTGSEAGGTAANSQATAGTNQGDKVQLGQTIGNMRQGYVSLQSKLGEVRAGTQYSFMDSTAGEIAGSTAAGGVNNSTGAQSLFKTGNQPRWSNAVTYYSPKFSGFQVKGGVNFGESLDPAAQNTTTTSNKVGNGTEFALEYSDAKLRAGYTWMKLKDMPFGALTAAVNLVGAANDANVPSANATAYAAGLNDLTFNVAGAQYDLGVVKLGANWTTYEKKNNTATAGDLKATHTLLTASVPVSANLAINAAYVEGDLKYGGVKMYKTKGYDLIGVYTLSKRTNAYLGYFESQYNATGDNTATTFSPKQTQVALGLRHSF